MKRVKINGRYTVRNNKKCDLPHRPAVFTLYGHAIGS